MRICILETDINDDPELRAHGTMPEMFEAWLRPSMPGAEFSSVAIHAGADLPDPVQHDGYLITGSRHGVYDDLPWMAPLAEFILRMRQQAIPVGGICFGHQIMAHAYGAPVHKSDDGWILGAETYDGHTAFAMHQDQVQTVPDSVRRLVSSDRCRIARLEYDFPALSVQYHPEFTAAFMAVLLDIYGDGQIDPARVHAARATLDHTIHVDRIAEDFAAFFRGRVAD